MICVVAFIGLIVCITAKETWVTLFYLLLVVVGLSLFFISIIDVQWTIIYDDKIVVRNIFGIIKEIEYVNIKKAFISDAIIFSLKMLGIHKKYLVISNYKSLQKSQIVDAYNRRKYKYLMIPFSTNVETMIKAKYKASREVKK